MELRKGPPQAGYGLKGSYFPVLNGGLMSVRAELRAAFPALGRYVFWGQARVIIGPGLGRVFSPDRFVGPLGRD